LLLSRFLRKGETQAATLPAVCWGDWIVLIAACVSLIYVSWFRTPAGMYPDQVPVGAVQGLRLHAQRLWDFAAMFLVSPIVLKPYRYLLGGVTLTVLVAGVAAGIRDLAKRRYTVSQVTLGWGLLIAMGVVFLPTWVNGSALFAERLSVPAVLLLAAAASRLDWPRKSSVPVLAGAACAVLALAALQIVVSPAAKRIALPDRSSAAVLQGRVISIGALNTPVGLTFDPCRWAGVRLRQQDHGVWVNPAWLGSPQLMLDRRHKPVPIPDMLAADPTVSVVIVHCGGPDAGLTAALEKQYPDRWTAARYSWANVLYPRRAK
jgi:hypothetical protein